MNNCTGRILRIEKTSIHDGDGLRTVVFLKGCPLRCLWCSTPESQNYALEMGYGRDMTVDQVVREISKDEIFYFHSGGGVTFSGGEPLLQAEFLREVLRECCMQGIPTAIETTLYAEFTEIRKVLPYLNEIYMDYKVDDASEHQRVTGVSNRKIRENMIRLNQEFHGPIHVRIPSIPGINMSEENMKHTAEWIDPLHRIADVELLPYHRLGVETYRKMGRTYPLEGISTPNFEEMMQMANILHEHSPRLTVKIKGQTIYA